MNTVLMKNKKIKINKAKHKQRFVCSIVWSMCNAQFLVVTYDVRAKQDRKLPFCLPKWNVDHFIQLLFKNVCFILNYLAIRYKYK